MKRLTVTLISLGICGGSAAIPAAAQDSIQPVRVLSSVRVGDYAGGVAVGFGSVWVADPVRGAVDRVSLRTGRVQATIHTGDSPIFVAVGAGAVWASNSYNATATAFGTTVVRISYRSDRVTRRIKVGPYPSQLTVSGHTLWVALTGRAAIARIDLPSGRVRLTPTEVAEGPAPAHLVWSQGPVAIAVAAGGVWSSSSGADALFRVAADSGRLTNAIPAVQSCGRMYAYGGTIWDSAECAPVIWRIDARTRHVRAIDLGQIPGLIGDVILARGSAWVTTDAGELLRIDPATCRVTHRYRLPSKLGAGSLAYAAGSLWESDYGDLDNGHGRIVQLALPAS